MIITCYKNDDVFKVYKIGQSIFNDEYRILVDNPRYQHKNASIVDLDGNERLFSSRELAAEYVFNQIDKYMRIGQITNYEVSYKK